MFGRPSSALRPLKLLRLPWRISSRAYSDECWPNIGRSQEMRIPRFEKAMPSDAIAVRPNMGSIAEVLQNGRLT